ncbi:MAG: FG-GAP-like repeat-containing protein [Bacteroidota bacterium]
MKKVLWMLLAILGTTGLSAQLYENTSERLPNSGASRQSMDVVATDIDGDGDLDLVLANEFQGNSLLLNDGTGNFNDVSFRIPQFSKDSEDIAAADFDWDGDIDLIFCSEDDITLGQSNVHEFYLNDGQGNFTPAAFQLPDSEANAVVAMYVDQDSFPDLIFGNKGQNVLLMNNGDGTFRDETSTRLPSIFDVTQDLHLGDIDGDQDLDLVVGNEDSNRILINDGNGFFTDESSARLPSGINSETRKVTLADVDGNQTLDLFLSCVAFIPGRDIQDRLYLNDGDGFFTDVTATHLPPATIHTLDGVFDDADGDGDLDLFTVGLDLVGEKSPVRAFLNNGQGVFTEATETVLGDLYPIRGLGILIADLNRDSLNDIYACDRKTLTDNTKDVLLTKKALTSSINNQAARGAWSYSLYPNPATTTFRVSTAEVQQGQPQFFLYNSGGKLLSALTPDRMTDGRTWSFEATALASGQYFLRIVSAESGASTLPLFVP